LGIVGIGGYGWSLTRSIWEVSERAGCRLVAAADARMNELPERAQALRVHGVRLFRDAIEMFDAMRDECDAMYVAVGIAAHAPLTIAALERGYHVHVEKPPAATVQQVDQMLAAAAKANRLCITGFHAIHSPDIRFVKDQIVSGRLGRIRSIACCSGVPRTRAYYGRNDWAGRLKCGDAWVLDGPATNAVSHQINNMLFWASSRQDTFATPRAVRAELYAAGPIESHDTAAVEIETVEGPRCYLLTSHCTRDDFPATTSIDAERGQVTWTMGQGATVTYADGTQRSTPAPECKGRTLVILDFVEAIRRGDPSLLRCDLAQARPAVLAIDGAHESSGTIHQIDKRHTRRIDEDSDAARTVVDGLDEMLRQAAESRQLLSDLPNAPRWTVRTNPFDLTDYPGFPQRFSHT